MTSAPYRILMVCTGNICRSPTMERLLAARLRQRLGPQRAERFQVRSAGTWGLVGEPMTPEAATCLADLGGDPSGFTAREITPEMISGADLVLTATREHRASVVTHVPRASGRALTVRELARLLGPVAPSDIAAGDPVERMAAIVAAALGNRGLVPLARPRDDDIGDPYRSTMAVYRSTAAEIDDALSVPLELLAPAPPTA